MEGRPTSISFFGCLVLLFFFFSSSFDHQLTRHAVQDQNDVVFDVGVVLDMESSDGKDWVSISMAVDEFYVVPGNVGSLVAQHPRDSQVFNMASSPSSSWCKPMHPGPITINIADGTPSGPYYHGFVSRINSHVTHVDEFSPIQIWSQHKKAGRVEALYNDLMDAYSLPSWNDGSDMAQKFCTCFNDNAHHKWNDHKNRSLRRTCDQYKGDVTQPIGHQPSTVDTDRWTSLFSTYSQNHSVDGSGFSKSVKCKASHSCNELDHRLGIKFLRLWKGNFRRSRDRDPQAVEIFTKEFTKQDQLLASPGNLPPPYIQGKPVSERTTEIGKFDAVVGDIPIIRNRTLYVHFAQPHSGPVVSLVVPVKEYKNKNEWIFLKPMTTELWLGSLAFYFYTAFVIWAIEHPINEEFQGSLSKQIGTALFFVFSTTFFAQRESLKSNAAKLTVIVWMFVVLILITSYTAILTSILTSNELTSSNLSFRRVGGLFLITGCVSSLALLHSLVIMIYKKWDDLKRVVSWSNLSERMVEWARYYSNCIGLAGHGLATTITGWSWRKVFYRGRVTGGLVEPSTEITEL